MITFSRNKLNRKMIATTALAVAGAAVVATSPATIPSAAAAPPPAAAHDLRLGVRPIDNNSAGHHYAWLTFRNTARHTVSLDGYSGVSFVAYGNGTQVGEPASWQHSQQPRRIVLRPGQRTKELLTITDPGVYGDNTVRADGLRVYVPGSTAAVFVPYRTGATTDHVRQLAIAPIGASLR